MSRRLLLVAALVAPISASAAPQAAPDPTGEWKVEKGYATIRVVDCDGEVWGVVATEQTPGTDKNNPDPRLRSRPTLGMPVLIGMKHTDQNKWSGDIYNSQDGRTYSANLSLLSPDVLKVQGCVLGFLCGGENWTRVQPENSSAPGGKPTGTTSAAKPPAPARPQPTPKPQAAPKPQAGAKPPAGQGASVSAPPPNPQTATSEEICSGLVGLPGGAHERRLK